MTSSSDSRLLVVSGLSGSGKSYVAHALEDIGWTTVDNLPLSLLEELAAEVAEGRMPRRKNAVVLDDVLVVLGAAADEIRAGVDLGRARVLINPEYTSGMASSLRAGLTSLADDVDRVAVILGIA